MAGDRTKRQSLRDRINAPGFAAGVARAQKRLDGQDAHYTAGYAAGRAAAFAEAAETLQREADLAVLESVAAALTTAVAIVRVLAAREREEGK